MLRAHRSPPQLQAAHPAQQQSPCLPASYWQVRPDIASKATSSWLSLSFSLQVPIRFVCRYDPVFQVKTIDGRTVWRRRHYRVKRDRLPGTFRFSVGGLGSGGLLCCASWAWCASWACCAVPAATLAGPALHVPFPLVPACPDALLPAASCTPAGPGAGQWGDL